MQEKQFSFPVRGYKLQSWLNFESSLGLEANVAELEEHEYNKLHWTSSNLVIEDEEPIKVVKKTKKPKEVIDEPVTIKKTRNKKTKGTLEEFL